MAIRFSLHTSIRSFSEGGKRIERADQLGYEAIFLADSQMNCIDPFQMMAISSQRTNRIRFGTAVTNMVYRDPTVLAGSAATLNEVSGGRMILGLGTGDGPVYSLGRRATRMADFEEGLRIIRKLVRGRAARFSTGEVALKIGKFPVPIYLSVEGPRGLRLAGRVADGVILGNGFDLRVLEWAKEKISEGAQEAGRDPSEIDLIMAGMFYVDKNGDRARALIRSRLANRAHHNFRFTFETVPPGELAGVKKFMESFDISKPLEERVDPDLITDYLARRFSIAGTPEECALRVREIEKSGVTRLLLTPPQKNFDEMMEVWARDVISLVESS